MARSQRAAEWRQSVLAYFVPWRSRSGCSHCSRRRERVGQVRGCAARSCRARSVASALTGRECAPAPSRAQRGCGAYTTVGWMPAHPMKVVPVTARQPLLGSDPSERMTLTRHVIACGEPADVVTASFFADGVADLAYRPYIAHVRVRCTRRLARSGHSGRPAQAERLPRPPSVERGDPQARRQAPLSGHVRTATAWLCQHHTR